MHNTTSITGAWLLGLSKVAMAALCIGARGLLAKGAVAPLPLDVVVNYEDMESRSASSFSPDGNWVTLPYQTAPTAFHSLDIPMYSGTGVPYAEGNGQRHIQLIQLRTGERMELSDGESSNWGASWSPDGRCLAFYSD